mgnify:CR=1 FL=1
MQCDYFDAGACRSCSWMGRPHTDQLAALDAAAREALRDHRSIVWDEPVGGREEGFRNKAKMVVGGTPQRPTLGILDRAGAGVDLRGCGLHEPALHDALPVLAEHLVEASLVPYDVPSRRGELKHLLVTVSPDGELMVRWVLRSTESLPRLRKHLPALLERLPVAVASANLQPEHKAVLEGPEEVLLTERATLPMRFGTAERPVLLQLPPGGFFQTNTEVAVALYREVADRVAEVAPRTLWDLYCGVGGFALHAALHPAHTPDRVVGVEVSAEAVDGARRAATDAGLGPEQARFLADDATAWARTTAEPPPDLVVVNPPRRGLGPDLAGWLEDHGPRHVVYSSCRVESLARDLADMASYAPVSARVLDMFPQTAHAEVLTVLERR